MLWFYRGFGIIFHQHELENVLYGKFRFVLITNSIKIIIYATMLNYCWKKSGYQILSNYASIIMFECKIKGHL